MLGLSSFPAISSSSASSVLAPRFIVRLTQNIRRGSEKGEWITGHLPSEQEQEQEQERRSRGVPPNSFSLVGRSTANLLRVVLPHLSSVTAEKAFDALLAFLSTYLWQDATLHRTVRWTFAGHGYNSSIIHLSYDIDIPPTLSASARLNQI